MNSDIKQRAQEWLTLNRLALPVASQIVCDLLEEVERLTMERERDLIGQATSLGNAFDEIAKLQSQLTSAQEEVEKLNKDIENLEDELEHYRGIAITEGATKAQEDYQTMKDQLSRYEGAVEVEGYISLASIILAEPITNKFADDFDYGQRVRCWVKGVE